MCPWYLSLIILTYAANGFQFKCPPSTQRQFRAKALCSNTATYYCLQDDLKGGFTENCSRVDYDQPGKRIILRGGFDNGPCSENLYQPRVIKYWTNVSTDCIYHKSLCSEEGQVEYDDGGVHFDKTCTCEYTRGYTFVNIPRNPCFCQPLTEDCSCYKKTDMNDSWWKDHDCSFPFDKISGHVLLNERQIKTTKQPDNSRVERTSFIYEMHSSFIWHFGKQKSLLMGLIIVMCLILVLLTTLLSYATLDKTNGCYNLKNKYLFKAFVTRPFASSLECFEGNSFTLECEISVGTVRCFKGLTDITDKWTIIKRKYGYHYELNISVMRREDSDTYSIRDESGSTLLETLLCCKKILIDYPPRQLECLEGDICTFTWKVISEDVKLYKDGDILSMNNCLSRTENTYTFTLSAMTDQDGGKYTLQNTNGYTFSTTLLTFKKNVTVFPNERVECVEGDQCCLQWKVISRDVQLYKNDQIITKFFLYTNDVYTFTVNSMSTEDEGKYTLRNQNGYIFTITNLFLKQQIGHICEFCSDQRVLLCDNCQQDMCSECFDKHQLSTSERGHRGVIYDKFILERTFDVDVSSIVDMVVLPDGLLLLADNFCEIFTYDIDGVNHEKQSLHISRPSYCNSLTVIDINNVAVSSVHRVFLLDFRRKNLIRNVTFTPNCSGIMFIDNMLYVGCKIFNFWSIQVLDIPELQVQNKIPLSYQPRCLRYGNNGRIYCLTDTRAIVIYDLGWNELFTMEDLNIQRTVANITVDDEGNAFVLSDNFNGCVIRITPNGKAIPVQSLKTTLQFPSFHGLCFNTESRRLFHFFSGKICMYKMKKG